MKITFYGGAGSVTGANYLLDSGSVKCVIDCGLHQGSKYAEDLNYQPFAYDPTSVAYVFITHSHIDHIGRLPKLYHDGFRGVIYTTDATADLMAVALPDNMMHIAREAEEEGHQPLFDEKDLQGALGLVRPIHYNQVVELEPGVTATLHDAGHVLGSSIVEIAWTSSSDGASKKIFFSGDLGNPPTPLLKPTEFVHDASYVVVESAYGDRVHEDRTERKERLTEIITAAMRHGGVLMIPAFALERTQELLFELNDLHQHGSIPSVPIFFDSPLAIKITEVYEKHIHDFNAQAIKLSQNDDLFSFPSLRVTPTSEESKHINDVPPPKIIIAGSGMSQGGRILHHERRYLSDPRSTILFAGYQVDGSLGRRIQKGEKEVRIFGEPITVRCHVETLSGYSAHADQPALLHWVKEANTHNTLQRVFVVQGETTAAKTLANLIHEDLDIEAVVPKENESFEI